MKAVLLLEDGTVFEGKGFGAEADYVGEVVFNTGITGYQEVLSDPSYCGQIVTMTFPQIGNYGIARNDFEAVKSYIHGFVVRELEDVPSNWRAEFTLDEVLKEYGIPGISDIDTRQLTRILRRHGTMKGIISTSGKPLDELKAMLAEGELITDPISRVSSGSTFSIPGSCERVVVVDFGSKSGIIRDLTKLGCDVVVVPHNVTAEQIHKLKPDGVLLSNGPGDPKQVLYAVDMVRDLLGIYPVFGICLGHQLLALASGADTIKLKFGHRGGNHPVKDLRSGRCYITSQNHGYAVDADSIAGTDLIVTHINNNDKTIEGLSHSKYPAFSVQYHPEASPGPFDSRYLFEEFIALIRDWKSTHPSLPKQAQFANKAASAEVKGDLAYAQK